MARSIRKTSKKESDEKFAMKMFRRIRNAPALMTHEEMYSLENKIQADSQARRTALAVVSMPGGELMKKIEDDREAAVAMACAEEVISDYLIRLRSLVGLVEHAQVRLGISLAYRPDMAEIMEEAKKQVIISD